MRCLYCDRSLGILTFRVTQPFCSSEHRKLHYSKADPPLATLLDADPHLVDRLTVPSMEEWIPALTRQAQRNTWPGQTLRDPAVTSTGPVVESLRPVAEVEHRKGAGLPAPIEFSTVVYVVPPGDQELTAADLRDRILKVSHFTATLRITLTSSATSRALAGAYGPELLPSTPPMRLPGISNRNIELPSSVQLTLSTPYPDVIADSKIAWLDPIRLPPHSLLTLGWARKTCDDSCSLKRHGQLPCTPKPVEDTTMVPHPLTLKKLTTRQARAASIFAPLMPRSGETLQKTLHNAEHLT